MAPCQVPSDCDRRLLSRAISEIQRLRLDLGASDMAAEAARSEAARLRMTGADRWDRCAERLRERGFGAYEPMGRPVPGTMQPREDAGPGAPDDTGLAPGARGAAPLVRTVVIGAPRSLITLFA